MLAGFKIRLHNLLMMASLLQRAPSSHFSSNFRERYRELLSDITQTIYKKGSPGFGHYLGRGCQGQLDLSRV